VKKLNKKFKIFVSS